MDEMFKEGTIRITIEDKENLKTALLHLLRKQLKHSETEEIKGKIAKDLEDAIKVFIDNDLSKEIKGKRGLKRPDKQWLERFFNEDRAFHKKIVALLYEFIRFNLFNKDVKFNDFPNVLQEYLSKIDNSFLSPGEYVCYYLEEQHGFCLSSLYVKGGDIILTTKRTTYLGNLRYLRTQKRIIADFQSPKYSFKIVFNSESKLFKKGGSDIERKSYTGVYLCEFNAYSSEPFIGLILMTSIEDCPYGDSLPFFDNNIEVVADKLNDFQYLKSFFFEDIILSLEGKKIFRRLLTT